MKNIFQKVKDFFKQKNINFNLIIILLIVLTLVIGGNMLKNYSLQKQELNAKIERTKELQKLLIKAENYKQIADSINKSSEVNYEKINQNEKIDWTDLYTSSPDSIALEITKWRRKGHNNN